MCCDNYIQGFNLMKFYQLTPRCFVTFRKKMQSPLICRLDCDANNIFLWERRGETGKPDPLLGKGAGEEITLFPAVGLLRRIHLIKIAARFRRRVTVGEGGIDIPGVMLLIILAAWTLSLEKTRNTLPAPPLYAVITA